MNAIYDLHVPIVRHGLDGHVVVVDLAENPEAMDALQSVALFLIDPILAGACISLAAEHLISTETI